jgi:hypothetical protein
MLGVSSHITTLMMGTEIVPETSVSTCNQLTRLCAREDFIAVVTILYYKFSHCFAWVRNLSLSLSEKYKIWVFENRVVRIKFGHKGGKVTGGWRK